MRSMVSGGSVEAWVVCPLLEGLVLAKMLDQELGKLGERFQFPELLNAALDQAFVNTHGLTGHGANEALEYVRFDRFPDCQLEVATRANMNARFHLMHGDLHEQPKLWVGVFENGPCRWTCRSHAGMARGVNA